MLQAVKINRKLHSVGEVSPVLVELDRLWEKTQQRYCFQVSYRSLSFSNHVNLRGSQFDGRHFIPTRAHLWPDVTPLARGHKRGF